MPDGSLAGQQAEHPACGAAVFAMRNQHAAVAAELHGRRQCTEDLGPEFERAHSPAKDLLVGGFEFGERAQHAGGRPAGRATRLWASGQVMHLDSMASARESECEEPPQQAGTGDADAQRFGPT